MRDRKDLLAQTKTSIFEEWGLATYLDGFLIGFFIAFILRLGIIKIVTPLEKLLIFSVVIFGVVLTFNKAFRRKSLITPPWDGFISGFGVVLGIISIIETYILSSILL
jgi:hypothetical protein